MHFQRRQHSYASTGVVFCIVWYCILFNFILLLYLVLFKHFLPLYFHLLNTTGVPVLFTLSDVVSRMRIEEYCAYKIKTSRSLIVFVNSLYVVFCVVCWLLYINFLPSVIMCNSISLSAIRIERNSGLLRSELQRPYFSVCLC